MIYLALAVVGGIIAVAYWQERRAHPYRRYWDQYHHSVRVNVRRIK